VNALPGFIVTKNVGIMEYEMDSAEPVTVFEMSVMIDPQSGQYLINLFNSLSKSKYFIMSSTDEVVVKSMSLSGL